MAYQIEKLIQGGAGLTTSEEGKRILVMDVLPGELVELGDSQEKAGYIRSTLKTILQASEERITPPCPYWGVCGGCDFQYAKDEAQGILKEGIVLDNIKRLGGIDSASFRTESLETGPAWGYRNRVRFHVDIAERKVGFLGRKSKSLVPIDHCPILSDKLNALLENPDRLFKAARILMFSNKGGRSGFIEVPVFSGDDEVSLLDEVVKTTVGGHTFFVTASVFFQSNEYLIPALTSYVASHAVGDTVMDLYSGVGTFSAFLQQKGRRVIAVERQRQCLSLAKRHTPDCEFYSEPVERWAKERKDSVDTVVVDPPRVGLDASLPSLIASWNSQRIIYVSCNSVTLGRDLQRFASEGYTLTQVKVFDLYPQTFHSEVVAILDR
ncbi:MAG: class I SAM-dependent RNA methyltransferase [Sphaerochaeta sp.]|nr:class I SAM-dependent RNA methyltransferase [Sphaerochaeta sp.]